MYLSPTAYLLWKRNQDEFYMRYLTKVRAPRDPATGPMQVGTVFDLMVKHYLAIDLGMESKLNLSEFSPEIFKAGAHVFQAYFNCGAYESLLNTLREAQDVQMEQKTTRDIGGATIGGYPDLSFISKEGVPVILDFKVNGYFSKYGKSPAKGWLKLYHWKKNEWVCKHLHRDAVPVKFGDVRINSTYGLEDSYRDWGVQLSFYGWILGHTEFVTQVEQIVAKPNPEGRPILRVASHSTKSSDVFLKNLRDDVILLWDIMHSDYYFRDRPRKESDLRCALLERRAVADQEPDSFTLVDLKDCHVGPIGSES